MPIGGLDAELSQEAKRTIDSSDLLLSPVVVFEFDYLFRKKRIGLEARSMMLALEASFGVSVCRSPLWPLRRSTSTGPPIPSTD